MLERRTICVEGVVQGVGFRPHVHQLATRLGVRGFVRNLDGCVQIDVEGEARLLELLLNELACSPPPLARVSRVSWERRDPRGASRFRIEASEGNVQTTSAAREGPLISPDVATCDRCLTELFDSADRRFRYPFLNCTNCGPRLTIITGAPYDRGRTTMAGFAMCPACRAEYDDPTNRRFHAQPTACPGCGPQLSLLDGSGQPIETDDPLATLVVALQRHRIAAVKGLGGYHLACDARNAAAVEELRRRKQRDEKPFAVMVSGIEAAESLCEITPPERELLLSPCRPIVLLRRRPDGPIAEAVAPRNPLLGVMLPYTPLHRLLLGEIGVPLVMTSGNRSDEPIAYEDGDALHRLAGIADLFLAHNRPIHVRCDDSVTRIVDGQELPLRRSRGYAPEPIGLPFACTRPILAVGGQLKGTFALGRNRRAVVSHHLGDLDHYEAYRAFEQDLTLYQDLFAIRPAIIAHDLHPDYASTRYAHAEASRGCQPPEHTTNIRLIPVQHHHAHMASCMAEHGLTEPVIGVTFDGTGLGTDGAIWGGEFLVGDYGSYRRAAHLRYIGMPGGEQAIQEPWRMAVAHLNDAGCECPSLKGRLSPAALRTIARMLERQLNTPATSSAGRLFDAVAALVGVRDRLRYEGQAAIELEWLATTAAQDGAYSYDLREEKGSDDPLVVDTRPLIRAVMRDLARGIDAARIARRFHSTLVEIVAAVCDRLRRATGLDEVVVSGGVFMNALLTRETTARLCRDGFRVYRHRRVPPNDGGLSLGQLAVAAARLDDGAKGVSDVSRDSG